MNSSNALFNVPVLLLVFNRPNCTKKVFEAIAAARPSKLYVAADGARSCRLGEADLCVQVRAIATRVDWGCELKVLFREENLGCRRAVSGAIDWFFEHEEEGIILEDDCLPSPYFFEYAAQALERYRDNDQVMHIGGINYQRPHADLHTAYYYSNIPQIWGWATWRRAWQCYDYDLTGLHSFISSGQWRELNEDIDVCYFWVGCFYAAWKSKVDTWDYQWMFSVLANKGVSVSPSVNLVQNIGFGDDSTHTKTGYTLGLPSSKEVDLLKSLPPPPNECVDSTRDEFTFRTLWDVKKQNVFFLWRWKKRLRRRYKVKKMIKEILNDTSVQ